MSHLQMQAQDSALSRRNTKIFGLKELELVLEQDLVRLSIFAPRWLCWSLGCSRSHCRTSSAHQLSVHTLDSKQPPDNMTGEHKSLVDQVRPQTADAASRYFP